MRRHILLLTFILIGLNSCGQSGETKSTKESEGISKTSAQIDRQTLELDLETMVDTEWRYPDSFGGEIIIQNSLPRGGGVIDGNKGYLSSNGNQHGWVFYYYRFINKTTKPVEIKIRFPADTISFFGPTGSYVKIFLTQNTMTPEKLSLPNYGVSGIIDQDNDIDPFQFTILPNGNFCEFAGANDWLHIYKENKRGWMRWNPLTSYYFKTKHAPLELLPLTKKHLLENLNNTPEVEKVTNFLKQYKISKRAPYTNTLLILDL